MKPVFDIDDAIEVFVRGFAFTRCFAAECGAVRAGPVWVVRDCDRDRPGYRREEWVSHGVAAREVDQMARTGTRGRFCICAVRGIHDTGDSIPADFKAVGYRFRGTEAFMLHRLATIPKVPEPFPVQRVMTSELADRLAKAAGKRQVLQSQLHSDAPLRQYIVLDGDNPIGWARSIVVGESTWVSNVYVDPHYRRRGIGRSILAKMLREDRRHGVKQSVLLASRAGAMLYPTVGYESVGELYVFTPTKK